MHTTRRLGFLLLLLVGLGLPSQSMAQQTESMRFKLIRIRTPSRLALGRGGTRMDTGMPGGLLLVEVAREDSFWVRIQPTQNLQRLLLRTISEDELQQYLQQDWYFLDKGRGDSFDSDPTYLMANWFENTVEVADDALIFTAKPEMDASLRQWLRYDIEQGRVGVQCDVAQNGRVLGEGVILAPEWLMDGKLRIPMSLDRASMQVGDSITVSWRGNGVEAADSFHEIQRPAQSAPDPEGTDTVTLSDDSLRVAPDSLAPGEPPNLKGSSWIWLWVGLSGVLAFAFTALLYRSYHFWRRSETHLRHLDNQLSAASVGPKKKKSARFTAFLSGIVAEKGLDRHAEAVTRKLEKKLREHKAQLNRLKPSSPPVYEESTELEAAKQTAAELAKRFKQLKAQTKRLHEELERVDATLGLEPQASTSEGNPDAVLTRNAQRQQALQAWRQMLSMLRQAQIAEPDQLREWLKQQERVALDGELAQFLFAEAASDEEDVAFLQGQLSEHLMEIWKNANQLLPTAERSLALERISILSIVSQIHEQLDKLSGQKPGFVFDERKRGVRSRPKVEQFNERIEQLERRLAWLAGVQEADEAEQQEAEQQEAGLDTPPQATTGATQPVEAKAGEPFVPRPPERHRPRLGLTRLLKNAELLRRSEAPSVRSFAEQAYRAIEKIKTSTLLPTDLGGAARVVDALTALWRPESGPILEQLFSGTDWTFLVPKRGNESYDEVHFDELRKEDKERVISFANQTDDERVLLAPSIHWGAGPSAQLFRGKVCLINETERS